MLTKQETPTQREGYLMRPVRPEDLAAVVSLINAVSQRLEGSNEATLADIENFWKTPGLSLEDDIRIVFSPTGKTVGYVEALTLQQPPVHPFIWLRVHPDHSDEGVGVALLEWAEQRVRRVLEIIPEDLRVSMASFNVSGYEPAAKLLESHGFMLIRHSFNMHIDFTEEPPAPKWPEVIVLKPFDAHSDAEAVYQAVNESFSDHFGHIDEPFEQGFARFRHLMMEGKEAFDPDLWFLAMDGDEIAGISLCRLRHEEEPPLGWVSTLGVRRPWRKHGLGLALLQHSFGALYRRGFRKVGLGVDASNLTGALRLYENAGMYVARRYDRYEKELRPGKELMTTELCE